MIGFNVKEPVISVLQTEFVTVFGNGSSYLSKSILLTIFHVNFSH